MGSSLGTGGMATKLIAAELAIAAGVTTVITHGAKTKNIYEIIKADQDETLLTPLHTRFVAKNNPLIDHKWWIHYGLHTAGTIYVDDGAARAIVEEFSNLFAAGISGVKGHFVAQQAVEVAVLRDGQDVVIGKGLANYSSVEIDRIKRCKSSAIADILGYMEAEFVIHRENLVRLEHHF
jgi:glutamate 5-kinase